MKYLTKKQVQLGFDKASEADTEETCAEDKNWGVEEIDNVRFAFNVIELELIAYKSLQVQSWPSFITLCLLAWQFNHALPDDTYLWNNKLRYYKPPDWWKIYCFLHQETYIKLKFVL